jgi:cytochrome c
MAARVISFVCVIALGAVLAGCGGKPAAPPQQSASPASAQPPAAESAGAPTGDLAARIAAADLAKGKILFLQCRACHSLVPEAEPGKIGPTLYGVIGRAAGAVPGFAYSDAVARSGIIWSAEEIDKWLARPSDFLPGNKMIFIGIDKPEDRANIIAFIQEESAKPLQ